MTDLTDKELLDSLGVKVEGSKTSTLSSKEERVVIVFEEIMNFYKRFKRIPENIENKNIFERLYAIKLNRLIKQTEYHDLLREFDHLKLITSQNTFDTQEIEEDLDDEQLLSELKLSSEKNDLINLRYVRSIEERKLAEEIAKREICEDSEVSILH